MNSVLSGTANPLDLFRPAAGMVGAGASAMSSLAANGCMPPGTGMQPPAGCTQEQLNNFIAVGYQSMLRQRQMQAQKESQFEYAQHQALLEKMPQIPLGIEALVNPVPPGGTFSARPTPVVPMLITRLQVPNWVNPYFILNEVKLGRIDLLGGSTGIPAQDFAPEAVTPPLENPEIAAGVPIIFSGQNIDGLPHPFYASFRGIDKSPNGIYAQICRCG